MTFHDLPRNLRETALDTTALRTDTVDLFVGIADREADSLFVGFCDERLRLLQPAVIQAVDWRCDDAHRRRTFAALAEAADLLGATTALIALSSFTIITAPLARRWHDAAVAELGARGVDVLSTCIANRSRVIELAEGVSAAEQAAFAAPAVPLPAETAA